MPESPTPSPSSRKYPNRWVPKLRFRDQNLNQTASLDPLSHFGEKTHETVDLEALNAPASRRLDRSNKKLTTPPQTAPDETDRFLSELFGEDSPPPPAAPTPKTTPPTRSPFSSAATGKAKAPPPPTDEEDFPSFKNFAEDLDEDTEDTRPRPLLDDEDEEAASPESPPLQELSMDEILGPSSPPPPARSDAGRGVKREPLLPDEGEPKPAATPAPRPSMSRSPFSRAPFSRPPFSLDRSKAEAPSPDEMPPADTKSAGKLRLRKDKDKLADEAADLSDWDPVDDFSGLDALDEPDQPKKP